MKKFILGIIGSLLIATPALALPNPPSDISIMDVRLGHLIGNTVTIYDTNSAKTVTVSLSGCDEQWVDNERFLFIKDRVGKFLLIKSSRFFGYYNGAAGGDWDLAIRMVVNDNAVCTVN